MNASESNEGGVLVIGWGNDLRGDDGVGQRMAREIEAWGLTGIEVITAQQLTPEMAFDVARHDRVVFIDALAPGSPADGAPEIAPLHPAPGPGRAAAVGHHWAPEVLLSLALELYGRSPPAFLMGVPTASLSPGENLSPVAARAMQLGLEKLRRLLLENQASLPPT